jgi:LuxR family maltose regulon positive regulatory protein
MLDRAWLDLYSGGQATTLLGWIDRLPRATVVRHPRLALARGGVARAMGRVDEAEPWFELAEEAARRGGDEEQRRDVLAGVARHRAMVRLAHADVGEAVALARRAVAVRPEGSPEAGTDRYFLAICVFFTGMRGEAEALLREYLDDTPAGEQDVRRVFAMALLAQAHAERGELEAAEALIAESLATGSARGLDEHPPTQQVHLAAGVVALERGDADAAEARFEQAAALARRGGDRCEMASALLWLGRSRAAAGDLAGAADALRGTDALLDGARVPGLVPSREALEAALREAAGPGGAPGPDGAEPLSGEERDVLALLAGDLTYAGIAERLGTGTDAVRARCQRIRRHLGAITRDEAVTLARRRELI